MASALTNTRPLLFAAMIASLASTQACSLKDLGYLESVQGRDGAIDGIESTDPFVPDAAISVRVDLGALTEFDGSTFDGPALDALPALDSSNSAKLDAPAGADTASGGATGTADAAQGGADGHPSSGGGTSNSGGTSTTGGAGGSSPMDGGDSGNTATGGQAGTGGTGGGLTLTDGGHGGSIATGGQAGIGGTGSGGLIPTDGGHGGSTATGGQTDTGGTGGGPTPMDGGDGGSTATGGQTDTGGAGGGGPTPADGGDGGSTATGGQGGAGTGGSTGTTTCAGASRGNICWYVGPQGSSCQQVCTSHGQPATDAPAHVGTEAQGGSLAECTALIRLLGIAGTPIRGTRSDGRGLGCHIYGTTPWWLASPNFSATASQDSSRLVCGCTL